MPCAHEYLKTETCFNIILEESLYVAGTRKARKRKIIFFSIFKFRRKMKIFFCEEKIVKFLILKMWCVYALLLDDEENNYFSFMSKIIDKMWVISR